MSVRALHSRPAIVLTAMLCAAPVLSAVTARAQTAIPASAGDIGEARRALNEGRYGDVDGLLHGDADDPTRSALRARAAIAVGQYEKAVDLVRRAAARHPQSDAALELGLLHLRLGHAEEARRVLAPLASSPEGATADDLVRAGRAARALGDFEVANDLLRLAVEEAPESAEANTAWGELFLEKHNAGDARRSFEAALRADARAADAWLGLARVAADDDVAQSLASTRKALEINPSNVDGRVLMADLLLDAGYDEAAAESLRRALAVNSRSPEAHAYVAAIARLQNRPADFEAAIGHALAVNGTFGEAYRIVASELAGHYRFDEALVLARKAVALDPANTRAAAELGMNLLRVGEEDEARAVLGRAFDEDPYDAITYNLLAVLDALKQFETVRDGNIVLRLDPREAAVLRAPVLALAHDALATLSARYGFAPQGPILIEIFPHHDDFAVRNLGIPGLVGALGACFGRVVTMDSPRARPPGTFDWRATLWHELTHVVTLQMSQQRVPRWLTEGISVYEEQRARPEWRRPMEAVFARALDREMIPALADIDASFANPKTIALGYYHAGLVVGYLLETYGQDKFNRMVRAFAGGADADGAFSGAFGAGLDQVQAGFAKSVDKSFGPIRRALHVPAGVQLAAMSAAQLKALAAAQPDSYAVQMALAAALGNQGDQDGAKRALARAAELFPTAVGDDSPHALLADMAVSAGDMPAAIGEMEKQLAADAVNIELARRIAGLLPAAEAPERRQRAYERIVALDPFDADASAGLGRAAAARHDAATAVRAFRAAVAAGVQDVAGARCDLAEAYMLIPDAVSAKREVLAVLEQAPTFERAQELLLKLVEGGR